MNDKFNKKAVRGSICDCKDCVLRELMFIHLPSSGSNYVCKSKVEIKFNKDENIISSGDEIKNMLCIKDGLIKIYYTSKNNKEQIISIAKPYDFSYLINIFSNNYYKYNISAIEDSTICFISIDNIKKMVLENGSFAISLLNKLSVASDKIINNFLEINKRNLRGRVAYILLFFSKEIYKSSVFILPVSRKEIAEMIDMTTENVIRIMSEFRIEDIIRIHTKEIEIKDFKRLEIIMEKG